MKRFLPLLLVLAACEKEVSLNIPDHAPKLTLHCLVATGDTLHLQVGRSRSINEKRNDSVQIVIDATVIISVDGHATDTARFDPTRRRYVSRTVPQPGRRYSISVQRAGFSTVIAEAQAPSVVPISTIEYFPEVRASNNGGTQDEIRIRWTDPAQTNNIYMIDVFGYQPDISVPFDQLTGPTVFSFSTLSVCVQTADAEVESVDGVDPGTLGVAGSSCAYLPELFMRDASFQGKQKEFRFFLDSGILEGGYGTPADSIAPRVRLSNVTPAYLRYRQSRAAFASTSGNPFGEPVNVASNVHGGYGFFAIEGVSMMPID